MSRQSSQEQLGGEDSKRKMIAAIKSQELADQVIAEGGRLTDIIKNAARVLPDDAPEDTLSSRDLVGYLDRFLTKLNSDASYSVKVNAIVRVLKKVLSKREHDEWVRNLQLRNMARAREAQQKQPRKKKQRKPKAQAPKPTPDTAPAGLKESYSMPEMGALVDKAAQWHPEHDVLLLEYIQDQPSPNYAVAAQYLSQDNWFLDRPVTAEEVEFRYRWITEAFTDEQRQRRGLPN